MSSCGSDIQGNNFGDNRGMICDMSFLSEKKFSFLSSIRFDMLTAILKQWVLAAGDNNLITKDLLL